MRADGGAPPPHKPIADVNLLMQAVDPQADIVWQSVKTVITEKGTEEINPRTAVEWMAGDEREWEEGCYESERDSYHMLGAGIRAAKAGYKGIHDHTPGPGRGTFAPVVPDAPAKTREELFKK